MATVTSDALQSRWGQTFQQRFRQANLFADFLTDRSFQAQMQQSGTFYVPIDKTPLSVNTSTANLEDVATWTIPTSDRDVASFDALPITWNKSYQCGLDIAPTIVQDMPAPVLIRMAARRGQAVAEAVDAEIVSKLNAHDFTAVALDMTSSTTTKLVSSYGSGDNQVSATTGESVGKAAGLYDHIRGLKLTMEIDNQLGQAADTDYPFFIVCHPAHRRNLYNTVESLPGSREVFRVQDIRGVQFNSIFGMPIFSTNALKETKRQATDPTKVHATATNNKNFVPLYIMHRNAIIHSQRLSATRVHQPGHVLGEFYRIDSWLETATTITDESARWVRKVWVRSEA